MTLSTNNKKWVFEQILSTFRLSSATHRVALDCLTGFSHYILLKMKRCKIRQTKQMLWEKIREKKCSRWLTLATTKILVPQAAIC